MASRLLVILQNTKFYTKCLITSTLLLMSFGASAQTYKTNAFYEIVVVESLPEDMNLGMSLKDITASKNKSRVGQTKANIYDFLNKTLSPLLNDYAASENKSLVDLAAKLPVADLLEGLVDVNRGTTAPSKVTPADYMIVILPKLPESEKVDAGISTVTGLYSKTKASVIDVGTFQNLDLLESYQEQINKRLDRAVRYMYKRQFLELKSKEPFFVGALFNVHIEGDKTAITTQLVGGLPTDITEVFENANDQVHLKNVHSPKSPTAHSIKLYNDFPGAVVEFVHKPRQKNLMNLTIKFGSLGKIEGKSWKVNNELQKIEDTLIDKFIGVGLDFTTNFNTPNLTGSLQVPKIGMTAEELSANNAAAIEALKESLELNEDGSSKPLADLTPYIREEPSFGERAAAKATALAASLYTIKINIHEVYVNINTVEVERIRVSLKLVPIVDEERVRQSLEAMKYSPYAPVYIPGAGAPPLPTIEMESVNGQFTAEGNKALAPVREKLETVLGKTPEQLLNDPKIQADILKFVLKYMQSKQIKVQGGIK